MVLYLSVVYGCKPREVSCRSRDGISLFDRLRNRLDGRRKLIKSVLGQKVFERFDCTRLYLFHRPLYPTHQHNRQLLHFFILVLDGDSSRAFGIEQQPQHHLVIGPRKPSRKSDGIYTVIPSIGRGTGSSSRRSLGKSEHQSNIPCRRGFPLLGFFDLVYEKRESISSLGLSAA